MNFSKFHIVTAIMNPIRYNSRIWLYRDFEKHVTRHGAKLTTIEIAFGDRDFQITEAGNPNHIQFRSFNELWLKENALNIAISRLPNDWEYVAWIDADVMFTHPNWLEETVHQLQHYMFVQMFSEAIDLGPRYQIMNIQKGFMYCYHENRFDPPYKHGYGKLGFWHPGYAWAARREALDITSGLLDVAILGSADHHMAMALIGCVEKSVPRDMSKRYLYKLQQWQQRAEEGIKRDVGYVSGTLIHFWHGNKKNRQYVERWGILKNNNYDPDLDIKKDSQGLWQLTSRNIRLRDEIRLYFRQRNEDSIDT